MAGLLGQLFTLNQVQYFFGVPHQSGHQKYDLWNSAVAQYILRFRSASSGWFTHWSFRNQHWKWGYLSTSLEDVGPGLVLLSMSEPTGRRGWRPGPLRLGARETDGTFSPKRTQWLWWPDKMRTRNSRSEQQTGSSLDKYWNWRYIQVSISAGVLWCWPGPFKGSGVPGASNTWSHLWKGCILLHPALPHLYSSGWNPKLQTLSFKGRKNKSQF